MENVASLQVRDSTIEGYLTDVYKHLIPGLTQHWLVAVPPEWLEALYLTMMQNGAQPATAHHVHRGARTAWGVACARGLTSKNPVALAKPPRIEEEDVEPYSLEEVQVLLEAAMEPVTGSGGCSRSSSMLRAGLRDSRLHDARHTAATLLLRAGIVERTTQSLIGWGDTRIAQRFQHVTGVIQRDAASRVGTLLWGVGELAPTPSQRAIESSQTVSGDVTATGSAAETDRSH
jgi:site-specific recombinase XerD